MMESAVSTLTIRFSTASSASYRVDLEGPDVGERHGSSIASPTSPVSSRLEQEEEP